VARVAAVREERHAGVPAGRRRGEQQVLERAAEPDVHLAQERIDGADVARAVGMDIDPARPHREAPRLRVVRVGREDGRAQQPVRRPGGTVVPVSPCVVGGPFARAEHALLPSAPGERGGARDDHRGAGTQDATTSHHGSR
jgi:hypothetical protein